MIGQRIAATVTGVVACLAAVTFAQEDGTAKRKPVPDISTQQPGASAPQLVREGNKLLLSDKAELALKKYDLAKSLAPDAREIAFAEGLSHFKLGDYGRARERFSQVAGSAGDALADDALYSRGTCDHAEALASSQEPEQAMGKLESAMRTYRDVLARNPNHAAARDANFKAASMWRQLKQQMQQQEQQQQSDGDDDKDQDDQEKQDPQKQDDSKSDEQQDQKQDSQDQQSEEQTSSDSEQSEKDQEQQDQSKSDEQKESQQQAQQSQKEQVSREQAERKLREMLQELKDRQKTRQKPVQPLPAPRGGKDW